MYSSARLRVFPLASGFGAASARTLSTLHTNCSAGREVSCSTPAHDSFPPPITSVGVLGDSGVAAPESASLETAPHVVARHHWSACLETISHVAATTTGLHAWRQQAKSMPATTSWRAWKTAAHVSACRQRPCFSPVSCLAALTNNAVDGIPGRICLVAMASTHHRSPVHVSSPLCPSPSSRHTYPRRLSPPRPSLPRVAAPRLWLCHPTAISRLVVSSSLPHYPTSAS